MTNGRKRVLLMISSMRGGGSERQVLLLTQSLDRSRFEPHLYLTEAAGEFLPQVPSDVPIHSFDRCDPPKGIYIPGRQLRRQTEFLRGVISEYAIDVIYDRTFHMTMIAGKAAGKIPRISTIVSPPHQALPMVEQRFVALKRRRLADAYRKSKAVVAVSRQAALSAESFYGLATGSVRVVKNPVDQQRLRIDAGPPRPRPTDLTTLLCVGRMSEEKGHADLIEAINLIQSHWPQSRPPWTLRLVGDGPLRSQLESQAERLGLADRIQFLGATQNAASEIANADALVLPSRFEGMPNVVLEAMALGTPVIATRSGGTVELQLETPTAFWARPGEPASIAGAILEFSREKARADQHCRAALQLVHSEHDPGTITRQIEHLLSTS